MAEAKLDGFEGIYQLLTQYKLAKEQHKEKLPFPSIHLTLDQESSTITARSTGCAPPYLWSLSDGELHELKGKYPMKAGDFVFLMNRGFFTFYKNREKVVDLLTKVLKHFAQDGLETSAAMLGKEIAFATKRKDLITDFIPNMLQKSVFGCRRSQKLIFEACSVDSRIKKPLLLLPMARFA
jgi:hypothetical protein